MSNINKEPCAIEDNYNKSDDIIEEVVSLDAIKNMCIELGYYDRGIRIRPINPLEMCYAEIQAVICGLKHDIVIVDDIYLQKIKGQEILQFDFPILEKVKENHPHGWYRKFEKKRF